MSQSHYTNNIPEERHIKFADQINRLAVKTSISHPINISWVIPENILNYLSYVSVPFQYDLYDLLDTSLRDELIAHTPASSLKKKKGNLALSSCPGKKVRLSGPVRGRASINRDLNLDFSRMKSFGITMLVCCLYDHELEFLGASWSDYESAAKIHQMEIIRLPMNEGGCPDTVDEVKEAVDRVNIVIGRGESVLVHCRGGVGRAGLFACCWLLENMLCNSVERAVYVLRMQRSPKAIETVRQAEFIIQYYKDLRKRLNIIPMTVNRVISDISEDTDMIRRSPFAIPTMTMIAKLEYEMVCEQ